MATEVEHPETTLSAEAIRELETVIASVDQTTPEALREIGNIIHRSRGAFAGSATYNDLADVAVLIKELAAWREKRPLHQWT